MERRGRRFYARPHNTWREAHSVKNYNLRKTPPTYIWRPCIPSWEKEFTFKIGNFVWKDFVEAKKMISMYDRIMEWKDSACEEAFKDAKQRFWDHYNGYESQVLLPDPDMHIDKNLDWNSEPQENREDEDPMLSVSEAEDEFSEYGVMNEMPTILPSIKIEDIIPTGWDEDVHVPETRDLLTGFVVGEDDDQDNDNVLRDSINIGRDLPALRKFRQLGY